VHISVARSGLSTLSAYRLKNVLVVIAA
jgi:hypothetical protein